MTVYTAVVGETLTLYLEAVSGSPAGSTTPVAKLKPSLSGAPPPPAVAVVATPTVTLQPTSPGNDPAGVPIGPGWYVILSAAQTAGLGRGRYALDAAYQVGGGQFVSVVAVIHLVDGVSLP